MAVALGVDPSGDPARVRRRDRGDPRVPSGAAAARRPAGGRDPGLGAAADRGVGGGPDPPRLDGGAGRAAAPGRRPGDPAALNVGVDRARAAARCPRRPAARARARVGPARVRRSVRARLGAGGSPGAPVRRRAGRGDPRGRGARAGLDPASRRALDVLSAYGGPAPVAVLAEAAGGLGVLASLRDQGWLVAEPSGWWSVPASLRPGADRSARIHAADALAAVLSPACDPLVGPSTWELAAELRPWCRRCARWPTIRASRCCSRGPCRSPGRRRRQRRWRTACGRRPRSCGPRWGRRLQRRCWRRSRRCRRPRGGTRCCAGSGVGPAGSRTRRAPSRRRTDSWPESTGTSATTSRTSGRSRRGGGLRAAGDPGLARAPPAADAGAGGGGARGDARRAARAGRAGVRADVGDGQSDVGLRGAAGARVPRAAPRGRRARRRPGRGPPAADWPARGIRPRWAPGTSCRSSGASSAGWTG